MTNRPWIRGAVWLAGLWIWGLLTPRLAARESLDLSGVWQYQEVSQLQYPPPSSWQTLTVPGYLEGYNYERAWFRKVFLLPASFSGQRIKLEFGGVKFDSSVWVNGQAVGGRLNGYDAFALDITGAALPGQTNELLVAVSDWTALFATAVSFDGLEPGVSPRSHVRDTILAPIGGRYDLYGIWQPVRIDAVAAVSVADVFAMPSVRQGKLGIRIEVRNETEAPQPVLLSNAVRDGDAVALALPDQTLVLGPMTTNRIDVEQVWPGVRRWSPADPHLYEIETRIRIGGAAVDTVRTRFGFRELWAEGEHLVLNGTRIHLLATSCWPPARPLEEGAIRRILLDVKAGNNQAFRLHTQPWDKTWYRVADEVGLLIVEEAAVWCDPRAYRLGDPVFWKNYADHLEAAVRRDRNHPSIVMWSLENEILHCGGGSIAAGTAGELARLGGQVKELDPTRLITYEADLDPDGAADVIGLHYPHEYPENHLWPDTAWWMDRPIPKDFAPGGQWKWERDKPLYVGEFLYVPGTAAADFTILFGDAAYADVSRCRDLAKEMTWQMQIEAFRDYGVSAMCPWTMFEDPAVSSSDLDLRTNLNRLYQAQRAAYHPNAVFVRERDSRFFPGEPVARTLIVLNDTLEPGLFTLEWRCGDQSGTRSFTMEAAGRRSETVVFAAPSGLGSFEWSFELKRGDATVFSDARACVVRPQTALAVPAGIRLGVFDPSGETAALFRRLGLAFEVATNLSSASYGSTDVLVIGRNALTQEGVLEVGRSSVAGRWEQFMDGGGWIVVLEQTVYPDWMPLELSLEESAAHFAFPVRDHPLVEGLGESDLRWWRGDHRVADRVLRIPSRGNFRVAAHVGSRRGLEYAALIEGGIGRGGLIASQFRLVERFDREPVASALLQRVLSCACERRLTWASRPLGIAVEGGSSAERVLGDLGVLGEPVMGQLRQLDPMRHPVVWVGGGDMVWSEAVETLPGLARYVDRGGWLVLHRPSEAFLGAGASSLLGGIEWAPETADWVLRRAVEGDGSHLTSHDLHWVEQVGNWDRAEVLSTNVARRAYRKSFNASVLGIVEAEAMPIKTTGAAVSSGWALYSNGHLAQTIQFPATGAYLFAAVARGTLAMGIGPRLALRIDGAVVDAVSVATNSWRTYSMMADVSAGSHELALVFDNDEYRPPEDRNLYLDQIRFGLDPNPGSVRLLTRPGCVASLARGAGGILLDEIRWEDEEINRVKAERAVSTILSDLGVGLRVPVRLRLEAESMRPVEMAAVTTNAGVVYCNSNGRLETRVVFADTANYTFELLARGMPAAGLDPLVELRVDGVNRKTFAVGAGSFQRYAVELRIVRGAHTVAVAFVNDFYAPPEDRNVAIDRLTITPETSPRMRRIGIEPEGGEVHIGWETPAAKACEVLVQGDAVGSGWQAVERLEAGASWRTWVDDGTQTGGLPGASGRRFYRVRTAAP